MERTSDFIGMFAANPAVKQTACSFRKDSSKLKFFQLNANNEATPPVENKSNSRFMFAVVQSGNESKIPSISEMPEYQHSVGQYIKNLYDAYFQESLSDSPSDIDEFIQKYGLDRILHTGLT